MKNWRTVDPSANIHLSDRALLSDAELGDDRTVAFDIDAGQVVKKATAATNHHQKATAGVMITLVGLEMFGQVVDAFGQKGDLDFR